jgi:nucleotide-binding universal stress UspA family protein
VFENILVPLDGSEHSNNALKQAVEIARIVKGAITLIHVYYTGSSFVMSDTQEHRYQAKRKIGEDILEEGAKKVKVEGIKVETLLLDGDIVEQIVKTSKKRNIDLIVIGARGVSKIKGLLIGSVSDGVIRNAACPVLVAR